MEKDLHKVTDGSLSKVELLKTFYKKFMDDYNYVSITMWKYEDEPVGRNCPDCGSPLFYKK